MSMNTNMDICISVLTSLIKNNMSILEEIRIFILILSTKCTLKPHIVYIIYQTLLYI